MPKYDSFGGETRTTDHLYVIGYRVAQLTNAPTHKLEEIMQKLADELKLQFGSTITVTPEWVEPINEPTEANWAELDAVNERLLDKRGCKR